jgi:gamma-tubulin complex component 3
MARLVDAAGTLTGGALVSRLHAHSLHGALTSSVLVQRVMDSVCVPLYTMLSRWLLHGELHDPHNEFFVVAAVDSHTAAAAATAGGVKNMWQDSYTLKSSLLPSFIPVSLSQKILLIGKSINFLRLCLQRLPKDDSESAGEFVCLVLLIGFIIDIILGDGYGYNS